MRKIDGEKPRVCGATMDSLPVLSRLTMGVVYSMYDALVSISVPDEKAKAVIDALEREMMDKLATKADVAHLKEILSRDIRAVQEGLSHDIRNVHEVLSQDIRATQESFSQSIRATQESFSQSFRGLEAVTKAELTGLRESMATKVELANLGKDLTTRIFLVVGGATALTISILGMLIKFS